MSSPGALALALVVCAGGCSERVIDLFGAAANADGSVDAAAADLANLDGGAPAGGPDMQHPDGACPPIHFGGDDPDSCAASRAAALFRYALCTCDTLAPAGEIATQSIDSSGASVPPLSAAAVGSNAGVATNMPLAVGGALYAVSSVMTGGAVSIAESLHVGAGVQASTGFAVGGDAYVGGSVNGPVMVGGTLYLPEGAQLGGGAGAMNIVRQPVLVVPPCECVPMLVGAFVSAHAGRNNDNLGAHVDPNAFTEMMDGRHAALDLPCGNFYLGGVNVSDDVTINVHGRAALYVDEGMTVGGALRIALDAGAELDLFINGALSVGSGSLGDPLRPTALRLWVASQGALLLDGRPTIAASLYAPQAEVHAPAGLDLHGAALVKNLLLDTSRLSLTYDRGLLSAGNRACGTRVQDPVH